jgi:hypothetical protein
VLPELTSTVTVHRQDDAAANSVLGTVGPSGVWRYGNEPRPSPPADWKAVTFEGASIQVPPDWQTVSSSDPGIDPCTILANTVVLGLSTCAEPSLQRLTDGVRLFLGGPRLTAHPGWPEQQVSIQFDTAPSVVLEVGYGEDPSVGLAILNSLTAPAARETPKADDHVLPDVSYVAFGESVMLGAKPALDARGITTLAEVLQGPAWELEQLQLFASKSHITHGVVIQLGTNGTVTREQYEAVLAEVADVPRVVVMTVRAPKPWIAANNEIIRSLAATHPNVVVLDWEARSQEIADHLATDGAHLSDDVAKQFFRDITLDALGLPT